MLKNSQTYFKNNTLKIHSNIKVDLNDHDTLVSTNQEQFLLNFTKESRTDKNMHEKGLKTFIQFPVDTGRKLNVHKTFRRRPGRLLNVLCRFNLRPVCAEL